MKRAVRKSDNKQFAVKVIKKSKLNSEELAVVHDEVEIMHKVRHAASAFLGAVRPPPLCAHYPVLLGVAALACVCVHALGESSQLRAAV